MARHDSRIWVLVAGNDTARIYSSGEGVYEVPAATLATGGERRFCGRTFSHVIADVLHEGARAGAYDGLIVVAPPAISRDLEAAMDPAMAPLVIGRIVKPECDDATASVTRFLTAPSIQ